MTDTAKGAGEIEARHKFSCPDGELDEVFISNASVHIERMDDTAFWIGIESEGKSMLHLNTGVHRGTWYFNIEVDSTGNDHEFLQVERPRKGPQIPCRKPQDYERISKAEQALAQAQAENQRLTDLVRYSRHYLHEEQLIDDKEFADLVADSENGTRVSRLEGYDRLQERIAALQAERDTLKAEVLALKSTNEDARLNYQTLSDERDALRKRLYDLSTNTKQEG